MSTKHKLVKECTDRSVDTDIDSQKQTQRERILDEWDKASARKQASRQGLELTDAHTVILLASLFAGVSGYAWLRLRK